MIKAFNNIYAKHLLERGQAPGTSNRIALPIAGDDPTAKRVVMEIVDELGFEPVDAGGLDNSWRQQPGTPVYTTDRNAEGVREALLSSQSQTLTRMESRERSMASAMLRYALIVACCSVPLATVQTHAAALPAQEDPPPHPRLQGRIGSGTP